MDKMKHDGLNEITRSKTYKKVQKYMESVYGKNIPICYFYDITTLIQEEVEEFARTSTAYNKGKRALMKEAKEYLNE